MKKLIATGLAAALIAGISTISQATPVGEMDIDISGIGQMTYSWSQQNTVNDELDLTRLRLNVNAQPAENVSFISQFELTNNISNGTAAGPNLQNAGAAGNNIPTDPNNAALADGTSDSRIIDMYIDLTYLEWMTARIGQFANPVSYELNTKEYELETINYSMGVGIFGVRDRGIMVFGQPIPEFGWNLWGLNGNGAITGANNDTDDQATYGLQFDWNPLENLNFKLSGQFQEETAATADMDAFGIGFNYSYAGFHLFGEYNDADVEMGTGATAYEADITEWFINASYVIPETTLQLVLRYDKMDLDSRTGAAAAVNDVDTNITTAGFNWDFEKNARLQVMREFVDGSDNDNFDVMLGIRF